MARKLKSQEQVLSGSPSGQFTNFSPKPIQANRSPTTLDTGFAIGQIWVNITSNRLYGLASVSMGAAQWNLLGANSSDLDTLTGDSGGALSPTGGNINILGSDFIEFNGVGSTLTLNLKSGAYPITPFVVGKDITTSGFGTIQSAIDAADAAGGGTVYIQPGVYTEDLTLLKEVNLLSSSDEESQSVIIIGSHLPDPVAGNISIKGIRLEDVSAILFSTAAGACNISFSECLFEVNNGFTCDLLNWTGSITINDCRETLGVDDGIINNTGGATIFLKNSTIGLGTLNSMTINGFLTMETCFIGCPVAYSGFISTVVFSSFSRTLTTSGTAAMIIANTQFLTLSGASIDHSSAGIISLMNGLISTTADPAIIGTGTIDLSHVVFNKVNNIAAGITITTVPEVKCGSFATSDQATAMSMRKSTLAAEGTDADVSILFTPQGIGDVTATSGSLQVSSVGQGFDIAEGADARMGTAVLVGGTVTVPTTAVTADGRIMVTSQIDGGTPGFLRVSARTVNVDFTITSGSGTDTSTVAWVIFKPM